MIFGDLNWFMLSAWAIVLIIGIIGRRKDVLGITGIMGVIFSVYFLTESAMVGLALICVNLYLLYDSIFS